MTAVAILNFDFRPYLGRKYMYFRQIWYTDRYWLYIRATVVQYTMFGQIEDAGGKDVPFWGPVYKILHFDPIFVK